MKTPINLFIVGPSGCGKSTQAKLIASRYHLTHFSMGQLFRQQIKKNTKIGRQAKKYIDRGLWAPSRLTLSLLVPQLKKINYQNFIIDGFPRKIDQCRSLVSLLKKQGRSITALIHLDVSLEEILKRRQKLGQKFQEKTRTDNTPQAIVNRHRSYQQTIKPILAYFKKQAKLLIIDGNRPILPIFNDIQKQINNLISS